MSLYAKSLLHLKPTYELVTSKVLFSLGYAAAVVGIPLYFVQIGLLDSQIGMLTGTISLLITVLSLYLPPVLERFNQRGLLIYSAFLASASFMILGFIEAAHLAIAALITAQVSLHVNNSALSVLFKDSARSKQEFTKDTGLLGSFANLGWFLGPLLGGLTLGSFGFKGIFGLAALLIMLGGLYVLLFPFKTTVKKRAQLDTKIRTNLAFYIANPQLRIAYLQCLGLNVWWGFVFVFVPIFMLKGGYSDVAIGGFVALSQLPLFLLEFKTVGYVARYGFKRIFTLCYISLAVLSVLSFFLFTSYLSVVLGLILIGSLALSFLEPISDLFFFNKVSLLEEEKAYPTYVTAVPIGNMLAKIVPGIVLLVFPDKAVFMVVGILMCFVAYRAFAIED